MTISICPTFICNLRCCYCYLGDKIHDNTVLKIQDLQARLDEINKKYNITKIDIFGGEISLLDDSYLKQLNSCCEKYTKDISVTTNLTRDISHIFKNIAISLNEERADFKTIVSRLPTIPYNFSLSIVVLPSIVKLFKTGKAKDIIKLIPFNCSSINFIQYSPAVESKCLIDISDNDYEYVIFEAYKFLKQYDLKFKILNIEDIMSNKYLPFMSENIFILPSSEYAWINFLDQKEYFQTSYNLNSYDNAVKAEYNLYKHKCLNCKYFLKCYTEHLDLTKTCSGHKNLLDMIHGDNLLKTN